MSFASANGQVTSWQDLYFDYDIGTANSLRSEFSYRTPWNAPDIGNKGVLRFTYQMEKENFFIYEYALGYFRESFNKDVFSEQYLRAEYRPAFGVRWSTDPESRFVYRLHLRSELRVFTESNEHWYGEVRLRVRPEFLVAITKTSMTQNRALQGLVDVEFLQNGLGPWLDTEPRSSIRWRAGLTWRHNYQWRFGLAYFLETDLSDHWNVSTHVLRFSVDYKILKF